MITYDVRYTARCETCWGAMRCRLCRRLPLGWGGEGGWMRTHCRSETSSGPRLRASPPKPSQVTAPANPSHVRPAGLLIPCWNAFGGMRAPRYAPRGGAGGCPRRCAWRGAPFGAATRPAPSPPALAAAQEGVGVCSRRAPPRDRARLGGLLRAAQACTSSAETLLVQRTRSAAQQACTAASHTLAPVAMSSRSAPGERVSRREQRWRSVPAALHSAGWRGRGVGEGRTQNVRDGVG